MYCDTISCPDLRITMLLPPNLLFSNITGFSAKPENIEKMETFVNDYLVRSLISAVGISILGDGYVRPIRIITYT